MQTLMFDRPDTTLPIELVVAGPSLGNVACHNWHYSGVLPASEHILAFYRGLNFDGIIAFRVNGIPSVLDSWQQILGGPCCEISRMAFRPQAERPPTTKYLSMALDYIRSLSLYEGVFTYADAGQGHEGTVYKAASFTYCGYSLKGSAWVDGAGHSIRTRGTNAPDARALGYDRVKEYKHRFAKGFTRAARKLLADNAEELAQHPLIRTKRSPGVR